MFDFVDAAKPYMHEQSVIAAMKGVVPHDELSSLSNWSQQIIALKVPKLDEQRHLIVLSQSS